MGGRKGYGLREIVGDARKVRSIRKELVQGIKANNPKKVVSATAKILAKSNMAVESLAHGFLFLSSIKEQECKSLSKKNTKGRRRELAKKWAAYRKQKRKKFDTATNRDVVDSATRVLGGTK